MTRGAPRSRLADRLLLVAAGAAAGFGALLYQPMLNIARPAVLAAPPPAGSPPPRLARRVVWVLVDGLRLDASRHMPTLNRLRSEGDDLAARSEFPTFTLPNVVAQASGLGPAASGVRSNDYGGPVPLDSIFQRAKLAGLTTSYTTIAGSGAGIHRLFAPWLDEIHFDGPITGAPSGTLALVHLNFTDRAGHDYGARSPEYAAAVERADAIVASIARDLDPQRDALVVTSDHGHLDRGGHGGVEPEVVRIPLVFWGAGVPPRPPREASGRDVGPTIVHLLGLPPLRHATGRSLIGSDGVAERQRAAVAMALEHGTDVGLSLAVIGVAALFIVLVALGRTPNAGLRAWLTSPAYLLAYGTCLTETHTLTFSATNNAASFAVRLVALGIVGGLAQLAIGGCDSLVPASLLAALAVGVPMTVVPIRLLKLRSAMLSFLPIPGLVGAGIICLFAAGFAPRRTRVPRGA